MDFKVAGTADAVTALQLDQIDGLRRRAGQALHQAKEARLAILDVITATIAEPRAEVAAVAPKIVSIEIPIDKIGEVIVQGQGHQHSPTRDRRDITVDDDGVVGTVTIGAKDGRASKRPSVASRSSRPADRRDRRCLPGRIVNIAKFGAFVSILPVEMALAYLKMSPLNGGKRIGQVETVELGQASKSRLN